VLTPAVYAATRAADAEPLPYLFVCAFVANAASFVLPISNPANLVIFGRATPNLAEWLSRFALPSALSIIATFAVLRWVHRHALRAPVATGIEVPTPSGGGRTAGIGITLAGLVLMGASFLGLGLPTFVASLVATAAVLVTARRSPLSVVRHVSWGVLPLVAGLFELVEGLNRTGVIGTISSALRTAAAASPHGAAWGAGTVVAVVCNLMNNLPAALIAGSAVGAVHAPPLVTGAVLIGIDLGPNLSITGSLAAILWLVALRREGEAVGALRFLRLGLLVMPPALLLALAAPYFPPPRS
jgi:arsenical pump membrane protein